jgi:hypothetical protein
MGSKSSPGLKCSPISLAWMIFVGLLDRYRRFTGSFAIRIEDDDSEGGG